MVQTVIGWLLAIVAVAGFIAGPNTAAQIASNSLSTIGITAGALVGGAGSLIHGFNSARSQSAGTTHHHHKHG
jgi:hypothetical protein